MEGKMKKRLKKNENFKNIFFFNRIFASGFIIFIILMIPEFAIADEDNQPFTVNFTKEVIPTDLVLCEPATIRINVTVKGTTYNVSHPACTMLVIDTSGSMGMIYDHRRIVEYAKDAAKTFVGTMNFSRDTVGVVTFDNGARLVQNLTDNATKANNSIAGIDYTYGGRTNIGAGIMMAQQEIENNCQNDSTPIIILLTDGVPNEPGGDVQPAINYARNQADKAKGKGTMIFTVGFLERLSSPDKQLAEDLLKYIATDEGMFYKAITPAELEGIYIVISQEMSNIAMSSPIVVDYVPSNITILDVLGKHNITYLPDGTQKIIFETKYLSVNETWVIEFNITVNQSGYFSTNLNLSIIYLLVNGTKITKPINVTFPYVNVTKPLDIKKTSPGYITIGKEFNYTLNIKNIGNLLVNNITLSDIFPANISFVSLYCNYTGFNWTYSNQTRLLIIDNITFLESNESITCNITVILNESAAGNLTNTLNATYSYHPCFLNGIESATTTTNVATISVVKTVNESIIQSRESVNYTYVITNIGNVVLSNITLNDDKYGVINCPSDTLAPGANILCWTVQQINATITNNATVTADAPNGDDVSAWDTVTVTVIGPRLNITKTANTTMVQSGKSVNYTYFIINTGDVSLVNITLTDDRYGMIACPSDTLAPGANMTCWTVQQINTTVTNNCTITSDAPNMDDVSAWDTETVTVISPKINITKKANQTTAQYGESVNYSYAITNTGDVNLSDINLTDDQYGDINCPSDTLAPGANMTCWTVQVITDNITNIAFVTAKAPNGDNVSAQDNETVVLFKHTVNFRINVIDPIRGGKVCANLSTNIKANITINATDPYDPLLENVSVCINVTCSGGYVLNEKQYVDLSGTLSAVVVFTIKPENIGQCDVTTCVDCDAVIIETNEADNCGNATFNVIKCIIPTPPKPVPVSPLVPLAVIGIITAIAVSRIRK
ncbi:hypothetical protein BEH94_09275 [Candidatus Altiarchaeales archaeon WOR_SM1_SCG]|nr:hypothetical protein BEH94_09275 [Candidatus Altiarchaeales archaeon WOR_SM1_SCG]